MSTSVSISTVPAPLTKLRATPDRGDLYLAGDPSFIRRARELKLVAESIPAARIRPVIIVHGATQQELAAQDKAVKGLDDLARDDLKLVLANPEAASIGQLARDVLRQTGHWEKIETRLRRPSAAASTVGTVNEVGQAVRIQPGSVGIVWDATAAGLEGVEVVHAPALDAAVQEATIGVLTAAKGQRATRRAAVRPLSHCARQGPTALRPAAL